MKKRYWVLAAFAFLFLAFLPLTAEAGEDEKAFTVTKRAMGSTEDGTLVGEYDDWFSAVKNCKQEDLANQYVITMNKDYTIPEQEGSWGKSTVNLFLRSKEGQQYTLKRMGGRDLISLDHNTTMRIENVILDGNNDGQAMMVAGDADKGSAHLILGKGTVVQNFKDLEGYDGTTFYLYQGPSILTIEEGAILQNNTATQGGGVIQARANTTINIKGGTFRNNTSASGGGVVFTNGTLNITGGTFEENEGKYGGALWIGSQATATIEGATFQHNRAAKSYGGAIWGSNFFTVKNSSFIENKGKWGGAIYDQKGLDIENSTFSANQATQNGGALAQLDGQKMVVKDSTFTGNTSVNAGAIYLRSSAEENTVTDCTFTNNEATAQGGAIWANNAVLSVVNSTFEENGKNTGYGGALCFNGDKTFTVKNSSIKKNQAKLGGGVFVLGGKLQMEDTTLEGNVAQVETDPNGNIVKGVGGAILSLTQDNAAMEMLLTRCVIKDNEARNGAGVAVESGNVQIKATEFRGNDTKGTADEQEQRIGGGLYVDEQAHVTISEGTKFIGNQSGLGGAIFDASCDYSDPVNVDKYRNLTIDNTTVFTGNVAKTGLYQAPKNYAAFTNLAFDASSDIPHQKNLHKSLLNNYDINYKGSEMPRPKPDTTTVKIVKVDEKGNRISAPAVFTITHEQYGTLSYTVTTDRNGEATVKLAASGTYRLMEKKAPEGYQLLEKAIPFTVTLDKQVRLGDALVTEIAVTNTKKKTAAEQSSAEASSSEKDNSDKASDAGSKKDKKEGKNKTAPKSGDAVAMLQYAVAVALAGAGYAKIKKGKR